MEKLEKCAGCNRINRCWFQKTQNMLPEDECIPPHNPIKEFQMTKDQIRFKLTPFRTRFGYIEIFVEDNFIINKEDGLPLVVGQFRTLPEAVKFVDNKLTPTLNE